MDLKLCILLLAFTSLYWADDHDHDHDDHDHDHDHKEENGECAKGTDEYCALCVEDKCSICYNSYLKEGICTAPSTAVENCNQYDSATNCTGCNLMYRKVGDKCEKLTLEHCLYSTDNTACISCDGLHKKDDETLCSGEKCTTENCYTCKTVSDKEECVGCAPGYYIQTDKSCKKLEGANEGCGTIESEKCKSCMYGYYVNSLSSVDPMTCKQSSRYSSVKIFGVCLWSLLLTFTK